MPTAYVTTAIEYTEDGESKVIGSKSVSRSVAYAGDVSSRTITVAVGASAEILSLGAASSDDLADFDLCVISSSEDGVLELVGTSAADNSNLGIKGGHFICLTSDDTLTYNAGGNFAGADDTLTAIKFRNDGASVATVRVVAMT